VRENFYVIAFESTHYAMMMEKRLKENFQTEMIPTPRCITASCGLSLKFSGEQMPEIIKEIKSLKGDKTMFHIYQVKRTAGKDEATEISWDS